MHKKMIGWLIATSASALLASCEGGGHAEDHLGDTFFFCDTMFDDGPSVDLSCVDCSVDRPDQASDEDLYSFASIRILTSLETQGASIKASLPFFYFPESAGAKVGVFITLPDNMNGILADYAVQIRTNEESGQTGGLYNTSDGTLKRKDLPRHINPQAPQAYLYFETTSSFSEIEVLVSSTGLHNDGGYTETKIHSLCSNGDVSQ